MSTTTRKTNHFTGRRIDTAADGSVSFACSCGWKESGFADVKEAKTAHRAHAQANRISQPKAPAGPTFLVGIEEGGLSTNDEVAARNAYDAVLVWSKSKGYGSPSLADVRRYLRDVNGDGSYFEWAGFGGPSLVVTPKALA